MRSYVYLCTVTDTSVINSLVTSMDPDIVRFYWMMSAAVDRKPRWRPATTSVGAYTTAVTIKTCQSDVQWVRAGIFLPQPIKPTSELTPYFVVSLLVTEQVLNFMCVVQGPCNKWQVSVWQTSNNVSYCQQLPTDQTAGWPSFTWPKMPLFNGWYHMARNVHDNNNN